MCSLSRKNSNWFKIEPRHVIKQRGCNDEKKLASKHWGNSRGDLRIRPINQRLELVKMQMHLIRSGLNKKDTEGAP